MMGKVWSGQPRPRAGTGLLTQRAADIIETADVIFYDQLARLRDPFFPAGEG